MKQLSLFPEENTDPRPPESINWNLWHGCTKASTGCPHCYMYRRDESIGKDPSIVQKTENFDLLVKILRSDKYKGRYKIPFGSHIWTCRARDALEKAVAWCAEQELSFDAINNNLPEIVEKYGNNSRKITCDYYIDDKALQPEQAV